MGNLFVVMPSSGHGSFLVNDDIRQRRGDFVCLLLLHQDIIPWAQVLWSRVSLGISIVAHFVLSDTVIFNNAAVDWIGCGT